MESREHKPLKARIPRHDLYLTAIQVVVHIIDMGLLIPTYAFPKVQSMIWEKKSLGEEETVSPLSCPLSNTSFLSGEWALEPKQLRCSLTATRKARWWKVFLWSFWLLFLSFVSWDQSSTSYMANLASLLRQNTSEYCIWLPMNSVVFRSDWWEQELLPVLYKLWSLYVALISLVLCLVNSSYLGLPKFKATSLQLRDTESSTWVPPACAKAWEVS